MNQEDAIETDKKDRSKFNVLYFVLTMILQIISFSFLFNLRASEYIVYIFSFLVFCVSPFAWIADFTALGDALYKKSAYYTLFQYKKLCLIIASCFVIAGIFLVILSNEKTRKQKVKMKEKVDNPDPTNSNPDLDQKNVNLDNLSTTPAQEARSKTILILYTTIITLMWGMVLETYSRSETFGKERSAAYSSEYKTLVGNILDQPHSWLSYLETEWQHVTNEVQISPLWKSFSLYCVTFIVTFFGFFMRMPYGVVGLPDDKVRLDKYKVINMGKMFDASFFRNIGDHRDTAIFFTCLVLSFILFVFFRCIQQLGEGVRTFVKYAFFPLVILLFGLFFGLRKTLNVQGVQKLIMFLIAILLASLGTPVIFAIVQLILEIFGSTLNTLDFFYGKVAFGIIGFLTLFLLAFIYGTKWIEKDSFKNIQIMNAVLVCMAISLFVGLTPTYMIFTNIYNLCRFIIETLLVYIVPVLIVVLSIVLFVYSFKNRQKGLVTDG